MTLKNLLSPALIDLTIKSHSHADVIAELVRLTHRAGLIERPDEVIAMVMKRETEVGTAIGSGVAIPHSDPGPFSRPIAALGVVLDGTDFAAPDNIPVKLVFLLLTPAKNSALHIRLMARICRLVKSDHLREDLLHATSSDEAAKIIAAAEASFPDLPD